MEEKTFKEDVIPPLPDEETFQKIVDAVYHSSFLTEERRRIWFRVVFVSSEIIEEESKHPLSYLRVIRFDKPRIFSANELMKLAPAADPAQVLIGVYRKNSKDLEIWGLIATGTQRK